MNIKSQPAPPWSPARCSGCCIKRLPASGAWPGQAPFGPAGRRPALQRRQQGSAWWASALAAAHRQQGAEQIRLGTCQPQSEQACATASRQATLQAGRSKTSLSDLCNDAVPKERSIRVQQAAHRVGVCTVACAAGRQQMEKPNVYSRQRQHRLEMGAGCKVAALGEKAGSAPPAHGWHLLSMQPWFFPSLPGAHRWCGSTAGSSGRPGSGTRAHLAAAWCTSGREGYTARLIGGSSGATG